MLRRIWTLLVIVAATVALGAAATAAGLLRPGGTSTLRLARVWSRWILGAAGVGVEYEGLEHVPRERACIFMVNHRSNLDIWALAPALPDATVFVAKRSLFRVPLIGSAMKAGGFIPLDRSRRSSALESLSIAARRLREGRPLVVFPEGTRSRDGSLGTFKKGAFHTALEAGAPIVPVAISGSRNLLPPGSVLVRSGRVRVRFGPPVDAGTFPAAQIPDLVRTVRQAIASLLDEERPR